MVKVAIIVGPTAVGKTELACDIAHVLDAEILSADSRQIYRWMDIGTAKPDPEQLEEVRHHMIDVVDPDERFTAADFGRGAYALLERSDHQDQPYLVVGGSGLYIRALVEGLFKAPPVDPAIRAHVLRLYDRGGSEALHRELMKVDPVAAQRIHPNDRQRLTRALEVYRQTGTPISVLQESHRKGRQVVPLYIGLIRARTEMYQRIDCRVERMVEQGFIDEVSSLLERGYSPELNSFRAVGYREMSSYVAGNCTLGEAIGLTQRNTRRYAKRQLTWFRNVPGIEWVELDDGNRQAIERYLVQRIRKFVRDG